MWWVVSSVLQSRGRGYIFLPEINLNQEGRLAQVIPNQLFLSPSSPSSSSPPPHLFCIASAFPFTFSILTVHEQVHSFTCNRQESDDWTKKQLKYYKLIIRRGGGKRRGGWWWRGGGEDHGLYCVSLSVSVSSRKLFSQNLPHSFSARAFWEQLNAPLKCNVDWRRQMSEFSLDESLRESLGRQINSSRAICYLNQSQSRGIRGSVTLWQTRVHWMDELLFVQGIYLSIGWCCHCPVIRFFVSDEVICKSNLQEEEGESVCEWGEEGEDEEETCTWRE